MNELIDDFFPFSQMQSVITTALVLCYEQVILFEAITSIDPYHYSFPY